MHKLDIILPCYNPVENWAETIIQHVKYLEGALSDTEIYIILVNDGSSHGIKLEDVNLLSFSLTNFTYINYAANRGKGYALRKGISMAKHDVCIYTDVDFPYELISLVNLYNKLLQENTDIVVGIRGNHYYKHLSGVRSFLSKILKYLNSKVFHLPVNDTQCGIKGFTKRGRELFLSTQQNRYLVDLEFVFLASGRSELTFKTVPVKLRPGLTFRKFDAKIVFHEIRNFIKLLFNSIYQKRVGI